MGGTTGRKKQCKAPEAGISLVQSRNIRENSRAGANGERRRGPGDEGERVGEAHAGLCALLLGLWIYSEKMTVMGVF